MNDATKNPPTAHVANAAKVGVGFGTALAIAISWHTNQSIGWAIAHGILSWAYVIYYAMRPAVP